MIARPICLAALLCALAAPGSAEPGSERRCTADGRLCIDPASYAADVCRAIDAAAEEVGLDAGFLARLLWRESLFDAAAVSPAGAQGIAQFMPETGRLRGLVDPFDPAEAIPASAAYLKELEGRFGNLGLAAAAYNAGETAAEGYLARGRSLPGETRAYVAAITGHPVAAWRDGPVPEPDLTLDPELPFHAACLARAEGRGMPAFRAPLEPWGVVVAGQATRAAAERRARALSERPAAPLSGERIDYVHARYPGMARPRHFAQVGRATRAEAEALCERLRAAGNGCIVRRN